MVKLQSQMARGQGRQIGGARSALGGMAPMYGHYALSRAGHAVATGLGKGGELQNELTLLENLGLPQDQIKEIVKEARAARRRVGFLVALGLDLVRACCFRCKI